MSQELDVKGAAFWSYLTSVEKLLGKAAVEQATARLPATQQAKLRTRSYLPGGWYPVSEYRAVLDAVVAVGADEDAIRTLGRMSTMNDITTLYRVAFNLLTPTLLVKQSPRLFGLFYRGATVKPLEVGEGFARVEYSGCFGFNRTLWVDFAASAQVTLELAGAKNVRSEFERGGEADYALGNTRWE